MSVDLKSFVHWAIYKGYRIRYSVRNETHAAGILITPTGEQPFHYHAAGREIWLPDMIVTINEHGWELTSRPLPADPPAGQSPA